MSRVLLGILIGALLPILCAVLDEWIRRRHQRRQAMRYLRRRRGVALVALGTASDAVERWKRKHGSQ